jgi:hypothetical protein
LPEEEEGMGEETRERKEEREPMVYNLIIKGFQQCFPMHWKTLLKSNGGG